MNNAGTTCLVGTLQRRDASPEQRLSCHAANGELEWSLAVPTEFQVVALETTTLGVYLVGTWSPADAPSQGVFYELDLDGNLVRQAAFGSNLEVVAASVAATSHVCPLVIDTASDSNQVFVMDFSH